MRTTVNLNEALLDQLKREAAASGKTVSELIEESVRLAAERQGAPRDQAFELVTFGRGGRFTPLNVDKTSRLLELDDLDRYAFPDVPESEVAEPPVEEPPAEEPAEEDTRRR